MAQSNAAPQTQGSAATTTATEDEKVGDATGTATGNMSDLATAGAIIGDKEKASIEKSTKAFGPGMQFMATPRARIVPAST
jgi:hypothetical protein